MSKISRQVKRNQDLAAKKEERARQVQANKEEQKERMEKYARKNDPARLKMWMWICLAGVALLFILLIIVEKYWPMWARLVLVCLLLVLTNYGMGFYKKLRLIKNAQEGFSKKS